ncbi:MAG: peptidoglycan DD-metalloendopeptidase family protein, partial [Bacilli bacterium]
MLKKKMIALGLCFLVMLTIFTPVNADIDYAQEELKYENLCASASGFRDNLTACTGYEEYLRNKVAQAQASSDDISNRIAINKGEVTKLSTLIAENDVLIKEKEAEIVLTQEAIKDKEIEILEIEETIIQRIAIMQEVNIETIVYDFVVGSISLDQFLVSVDGLNAVNKSSKQLGDDLDSVKVSLLNNKEYLELKQTELEDAKASQEAMIIELKTQEAKMMEELSSLDNIKKTYDSKLDNVNVGIIAASPGFIRPVTSATITAIAWYYPASFGGGWHPGIDLANPSSPPIIAPANGIVLVSVTNYGSSGYGNFSVTAHQVGNDSYTFVYGHMLDTPIAAGTIIKQGDTL